MPGALKRTLNSISEYPPSQQWLLSFCEAHEITLKNQDTLEALRRAHGKRSIIHQFYNNNINKLNRNPRFIWNIDETSSSSTKKFKVLCQKEIVPLSELDEYKEHFTGLFPFN